LGPGVSIPGRLTGVDLVAVLWAYSGSSLAGRSPCCSDWPAPQGQGARVDLRDRYYCTGGGVILTGDGFGVGAGVGLGGDVGRAVGCGVGCGDRDGRTVGVGDGPGVGVGFGDGLGVGVGVGVGDGLGLGVGFGDGLSVGDGLATTAGVGSGEAVGEAATRTPSAADRPRVAITL
jgi:hypothetical protein